MKPIPRFWFDFLSNTKQINDVVYSHTSVDGNKANIKEDEKICNMRYAICDSVRKDWEENYFQRGLYTGL